MVPFRPCTLRSAGLAAFLSLAAANAGAQQTWYVDAGGVPPGSGAAVDPYTSVQYAIDQPTTADGDTLLVLPGTYAEVIDFSGKAIAVRSQDGAATTILQGNPLANPPASVVTFASGEGPGSVLEGFTIRGGNGTMVAIRRYGGGVYIDFSDPTLVDCVVRENDADFGGGAAIITSNPSMSGCTFEDNLAQKGGGGLYFGGFPAPSGDPIVQGCAILDNVVQNGLGGGAHVDEFWPSFANCTFSGNQALGQGDGGGVYSELGIIAFRDCVLSNNFATQRGGGGYFLMSDVLFQRCRLEENTGDGGGVYAVGDGLGGGSPLVRIEDSVLVRNHGGGVNASDTDLVIRHSVLDSNDEPDFGGGVYFAPYGPARSALFDHCTVFGNTAGQAGGGITGAGNMTVTNSILWGNSPGNLSAGSASYSDIGGGYAGTGNVDKDPMFWDPAMGDFELRPGSPCIDAGDPISPPDPDGSIADMGALPFDPNHCPPASSYCTAGATSNGCAATMSSTGTPSASAPSGFTVTATSVEGQRQGILFWGFAPKAIQWGQTYRCVAAPLQRTGSQTSGGTSGQCDGTLSIDFTAWMQAHPAKAPAVGEFVYMQAWFRDPPSAKTTSFSDGLRFPICP